MSPLAGEKVAVQSPLVRYAEEAGWTRLTREEALDLRGGSVTVGVLARQNARSSHRSRC